MLTQHTEQWKKNGKKGYEEKWHIKSSRPSRKNLIWGFFSYINVHVHVLYCTSSLHMLSLVCSFCLFFAAFCSQGWKKKKELSLYFIEQKDCRFQQYDSWKTFEKRFLICLWKKNFAFIYMFIIITKDNCVTHMQQIIRT